MIYLFNSCSREKYVENVLNTFFLPSGAANTYRYRDEIVPDAMRSRGDLKPGTEAMVVFVDRVKPTGYEFMPLRRAQFLSAEQEGGALHVTVLLGDFVFPRDPDAFQAEFRAALKGHALPRPAGEDEDGTVEGHFVIPADEASSLDEHLVQGEDAWKAAVDEVSERAAFKENKRDAVFIRSRVVSHGEAVEARPAGSRNAGVFSVYRGSRRDYRLELVYRYPQCGDHQSHEITVEHVGALDWGDSKSFRASAPREKLSMRFAPLSDPQNRAASIGVSGDRTIVAVPDASVQLSIGRSGWALAAGIFALSAYVLTRFIVATDVATLADLVKAFVEEWPKLILPTIETVAVVVMIKVFGKKLV